MKGIDKKLIIFTTKKDLMTEMPMTCKVATWILIH